jgi:hypothetical protein
MERPADQAKLLLFALLRSTATALATTGENTQLILRQTQIQTHNIQLRLATFLRYNVATWNVCRRTAILNFIAVSFATVAGPGSSGRACGKGTAKITPSHHNTAIPFLA